MDYQSLIGRRKVQYGDKFSDRNLDPRFVRYYENGERIKVETCGMVLTGTIGVTTGWVPSFLLMRTSRSMGSPWTLGPKDKIIGVKYRHAYLSVNR